MKSRACLLIALLFVLSGCVSESPLIKKNDFLDYIPVSPVKSDGFIGENGQMEKWSNLSDTAKLFNLPILTSRVTVKKINVDGSIQYLPVSLTSSVGSYDVVMEFIKYRVESVFDSKGKNIGERYTGVGLRVNASITTTSSGINVSGLANLSSAAKVGSLAGTISATIIGIDGSEISSLLPLNAQLDETSIQNIMQSLAAVKTLMWKSRITPQLIGVKQNQQNMFDTLLIYNEYEYKPDSNSAIIDKYWLPDGVKPDTAHTAKLILWMHECGVSDFAKRDLPNLLNNSEMNEYRNKIVDKIKNEQSHN